MSNTNDFKAPTHSSSKKGSYGLVSKSEDENSDVKKKKEVLMGPDGEQIPLQYDVPFWSHAPCFPYTLEILKDGKIIDVVNIHEKGYYLVGRIPVCDIVLEHPSISRQHAIIQARKSGEIYLYDLGSTHQTYLNKTPIKPKAYRKLKTGDMIQFGFSSRMFFVEGGPGEEIPNEGEEMPVLKAPQPKKLVPKSTDALEKGKEEESAFLQELRELKQSIKSDGMVGVNGDFEFEEEDYSVLKQTIDALEEDEDDEFYDRTKKTSKVLQTDTYETLISKQVMLEKIMNTMLYEIELLKKSVEKRDSVSAEDDLDAYMQNLYESPEERSISKKQLLIRDMEKELVEVKRFIDIVKPSITSKIQPKALKRAKLQIVGYIQQFYQKYLETNVTQKKRKAYTFKDLFQDEKPKQEEETHSDMKDKETSDSMSKLNQTHPSNKLIENKTLEEAPNQVKNPMLTVDTHEKKVDTHEKKIDTHEKKVNTQDINSPKKPPTFLPPKRKKKKIVSDTDSNFEAWSPPVNQCGDGRTNLNDKFGY